MRDKRRRSPGEGSFRLRSNGTYECSITVEGRRIFHTARSQREALAWIRQQHVAAEDGMLPADARFVTVGALLAQWLATKQHSVEPKTYQGYEILARLHIGPRLGHIRLSDVRADHLQALYNAKAAHPRTAQGCHLVMHQLLAWAVRLRLLKYNCAEAASPPRTRRREMATWNSEQANRFLGAQQDERWRAVYWLMLTTGVRVGELCGLRWGDVEGSRLSVRRNIQRIGGQGLVVGEGKTDRARVVLLTDACQEQLRLWKHRQNLERLVSGSQWQDAGYLITTAHGTPLEPRHVSRNFDLQVQRLGLPRIRLHDLRHTCGTLLLSSGVSLKVVQEILGHSSIAITGDIYAHATETMQDAAVEALERLFPRAMGT